MGQWRRLSWCLGQDLRIGDGRGELDGDVGEWELLVEGLLVVAGVEVV